MPKLKKAPVKEISKGSELGNFISTLSEEQKLALLASLNKQLDIKPLKILEESVKKKRGRPKKVVEEVKEVVKKGRGRPKKSRSIDEVSLEQDEEKLRETSKILTETRIPVKSETRKPNPLIKAKCKNCGREIPVATNFPNIKNFVCCIK